jgi:hexokinase
MLIDSRTVDVTKQIEYFMSRHPCATDPTSVDMVALRAISSRVARRSSAIVAASIVALWEVKAEAEAECQVVHDESSTFFERFSREKDFDSMVVAYNGSVIEQYPGYRSNCQRFIDDLVGKEGVVSLVEAKESSLLGAAVSLACLEHA